MDFMIDINDLVSEAEKYQERGKKNGVIDNAIIAAMCRGDMDAFRVVYLHSVGPLTDFLRIFLYSRQEAEDAVQDTFAYILDHLDKIDPDKNFKGYLYTVARSMAFRQIERRKRDAKYADYQSKNPSGPNALPDELVMTKELLMLLTTHIHNMPPQRKRVFEMSRYQGKSTKEIARELNISEDTVRMHLRLAVKIFRSIATLFIFLYVE